VSSVQDTFYYLSRSYSLFLEFNCHGRRALGGVDVLYHLSSGFELAVFWSPWAFSPAGGLLELGNQRVSRFSIA